MAQCGLVVERSQSQVPTQPYLEFEKSKILWWEQRKRFDNIIIFYYMFQVILSKYIDIPKLCSKIVIFYNNDTYNKVMDGSTHSMTWIPTHVLSKTV